ncbi:MAG: M48 family metalloprotease [Candidatus Hodarchaeota archaeon]
MIRKLCWFFNCSRFFRLITIFFGSIALYFIFSFFVSPFVSLNISTMIWMLLQFGPNLSVIIKRSQMKRAEWKNFLFVKKLAMKMGLKRFLKKERQSALVDLDEIAISVSGRIYFGKEHFKILGRAAKRAAAAHELAHMKHKKRVIIMLTLPIGIYSVTFLLTLVSGQSAILNLVWASVFFAFFPFSLEYVLWTDEFKADQESAKHTNLNSILSLLRNEKLQNHECSYSTHPPISDRIRRLLELKSRL